MLTILRFCMAKRAILLALFVMSALPLPLLSAQQVPPAPIPSSIAAAKKVFISNAPGTGMPESLGGPDRTYNEFYAAMKSWGRYELVTAPSDADLIMEISFNSSLSGVGGSSASGPVSSYNAELRLVILDPKIRVPLWWLNEAVTPKNSFRPEKADSVFNRSMTNLMDKLKKLAGEPGAEGSSSSK